MKKHQKLLEQIILKLKNQCQWCSLSFFQEENSSIHFKNSNLEHTSLQKDYGVRIEVYDQGYISYACTNEINENSIINAFNIAKANAKSLSQFNVHPFDISKIRMSSSYLNDKKSEFENIMQYSDFLCELSKCDSKKMALIHTSLNEKVESKFYLSSTGSKVFQSHRFLHPSVKVIGIDNNDTQSRSWYNHTQSELNFLGNFSKDELLQHKERLIKECEELLIAEECPQDNRHLILKPDQMLLQIHESIGHPLELDRILGDEINYAGSSFVKTSDFNKLQYGSSLLNVLFDPSYESQSATYKYDDNASPYKKEYLIKDGLLKRPLGGSESQFRAGLEGVGNARASSWNRPPIDRMANINLEPGNSKLDEIINSTERGILMETNKSWSIDDYRLKFQFGCEYARLIEDGEIKKVVKNPNYHGVTTSFWNNLDMVGDEKSHEVWATANCGKGEPNQVITVGHASPVCRFKNIDIFGGVE